MRFMPGMCQDSFRCGMESCNLIDKNTAHIYWNGGGIVSTGRIEYWVIRDFNQKYRYIEACNSENGFYILNERCESTFKGIMNYISRVNRMVHIRIMCDTKCVYAKAEVKNVSNVSGSGTP